MKISAIKEKNIYFEKKQIAEKSTTCPFSSQTNFFHPVNKDFLHNYINFGHSKAEHESWGAKIDSNGFGHFKLFSFPQTETSSPSVWVEIKNPSSKLKTDKYFDVSNISFVENFSKQIKKIKNSSKAASSVIIEMKPSENGVYECVTPHKVNYGDEYRFIVAPNDNQSSDIYGVKDPYSKEQNSIFSWSVLHNPCSYKWSSNEKSWNNNKNSQKVSRLAHLKPINLMKMQNLRILEINIPTFSDGGTFNGALSELKNVKNLGFNAIEIMPVAGTFGVNWGYDGVDNFAPSRHLGKPNDLKMLIDEAHKNNLNVIIDMVPNHIGMEGNSLPQTGLYFDKNKTAWGEAFNYEGEHSKFVQDYICNVALNWLKDYHCDGLRLDMTKFMNSDKTMKKIATEVHYHFPHAVLIAEDGRNNDSRVTNPLSEEEECFNKPEKTHVKSIKSLENTSIFQPFLNLGFDSEWNFPYHKEIMAVSLGNWENHHKNIYELAIKILFSENRVKYTMSHDEIGNLDGTRLLDKLFVSKLGLFYNTEGENEKERGQRSAKAGHEILKSFLSGDYEKMNSFERKNFLKRNHIIKDIPPISLKPVVDNIFAINRLAFATTMCSPGPKMIFQGDPFSLSFFKFFRKVSNPIHNEIASEEKGYDCGKPAFLDSKLNSFSYNNEHRLKLFIKDLNELVEKNSSLQDGKILSENMVVHSSSSILGLHLHNKNKRNDLFVIGNYSDFDYKNYEINFPEGKWELIFSTNDEKYSGEKNKNPNSFVLSISNSLKVPLNNFSKNGLFVYKKVDF